MPLPTMPPRDVARLGWGFILLYLLAGPFLAGLGLGAVTGLLRPAAVRAFDRLARLLFLVVIAASVALYRLSEGWSILFVLPCGVALAGIMLARLRGPRA